MFPGGTEGHCISVQKCFSQGMYNMLVKQILMNEGFVSPLMVLLHLFLSSFSFFFFATRIQKATETRVTLVGVKWRNLCITPLPWMYYKCFIKTWDFYMCCVWWRCCLCMFWKGDAFQFSGGTVMCLPAYPCKVGDRCTSRTTHFIGPI